MNNKDKIRVAISRLKTIGTRVSLFIDDSFEQILAAKEVGADDIEIHTGTYANARLHSEQQFKHLDNIRSAVNLGLELGLRVNAGHGLHYNNVEPIASIDGISELNIGHAIIARAVLTGLDEAVRTMKSLIVNSRINNKLLSFKSVFIMIYGIGTDIVSIDRINTIFSKRPERFIKKYYLF